MLRWSFDIMLMQFKFISFLACKKSEEERREEAEKKS
jgi:hypothetical protein